MPQFARPSGDSYNGDGYVDEADANTNIYESINEVTANDDDYIRSPNVPEDDVYTTKLSSVDDPGVSSGHKIKVRMKKDLTNPNSLNVNIELREGYVDEDNKGTLIATLVQVDVGTEFADYEYELEGAEADAITDYTDLYLRFVANPSA